MMSPSKKPPPENVSIIIPVWRDAPALSKTLENLKARGLTGNTMVVLGEDDPASIAEAETARARWIRGPKRGRGAQMNAGADASSGDILLFLHADTILPNGACAAIRRAIREGVVGGAFSRRFTPDHAFLRLTCRLADLRGGLYGWFLGDQAIFIRRDTFERLGGYRDWESFEDLDLSRRMKRLGPTRLLHPPVLSSARRFKLRGAVRQTFHDLRLTLAYLFHLKTR